MQYPLITAGYTTRVQLISSDSWQILKTAGILMEKINSTGCCLRLEDLRPRIAPEMPVPIYAHVRGCTRVSMCMCYPLLAYQIAW